VAEQQLAAVETVLVLAAAEAATEAAVLAEDLR